jgi:hypothetical protein
MFHFLNGRTVKKQTNQWKLNKRRPTVERLEDRYAPAVFNVNSLIDSLNPGPGLITLRSAIQAANTDSDATNTINLTLAGTYAITLPGTAGEVDNAAGEFSIFSTNLSTGAAKISLNIVNTSGGPVTVDGGRLSRVFDVNASLQIGSVNITAGGSGFTSASGITFSAPTLAGGIQATGNLIVSPLGTVEGVQITNPGTGYTSSLPPTITFTGPGTGAAGNVVLSSPAMTASMLSFTIQNGLAQPGDLAAGTGGGIRDQGNANLTLTNMTIANNSASADGGGVAMEDSSTGTDFLGGGTNPTLTILRSVIRNNHAGDAGGGIDTDGSGNLSIADSIIMSNTDVNQGAGVYLDGIANAVTSVAVTFGGTAYTSPPIVNFGGPGTGAAGFATISNGVVTGVTITNAGTGYTSAPTITLVGGGGAGATATASVVANQSANLTMSRTLVSRNTATGTANGLGGGISNAGNGAVTITAGTIADNFAATTGGGFSDENNGLGTLSVSNSLFIDNSAIGNGGAIFVSGPTASLLNTSIQENTAGGNGGGLVDSGITLTINNSTFSGNTANGSGGAIELETTGTLSSRSTITNSTLANNSALNNAGGTNGGGIDASATFTGDLVLLNDTITGNFADNGGGVFFNGLSGTFAAQNTIFARNVASAVGADANNPSGSFMDHGGNLIGISGAGSGNTGFFAGTTQSGTVANPLDPQLGPLQNNGGPTVGSPARPGTLGTEVPSAGGPAIDKGVASGAPTADERGYLRPEEGNGDLPDVGAVEFLTSQERFVQALYLDELGRPGSKAELDNWVSVLNGPGGANAVATGIVGSFEGRDHVVKGWYQQFLGRPAMNGEENNFVAMLRTQTEEQVLSDILGSQEFFNRAQTLGFSGSADSQFIQALYSLLLKRTPNTAEINSWLNLLPTVGRQGVALDFLQSQEYRIDTVEADYITLLHRIGDTLGVNHWANSNLDLVKIRINFEATAEFFNNG